MEISKNTVSCRMYTATPLYMYNLYGGIVEVKLKMSPVTTGMVELVNDAPYTLCQDLTLQIGKIYQLSFDVYHHPQIQ